MSEPGEESQGGPSQADPWAEALRRLGAAGPTEEAAGRPAGESVADARAAAVDLAVERVLGAHPELAKAYCPEPFALPGWRVAARSVVDAELAALGVEWLPREEVLGRLQVSCDAVHRYFAKKRRKDKKRKKAKKKKQEERERADREHRRLLEAQVRREIRLADYRALSRSWYGWLELFLPLGLGLVAGVSAGRRWGPLVGGACGVGTLVLVKGVMAHSREMVCSSPEVGAAMVRAGVETAFAPLSPVASRVAGAALKAAEAQ